MRAIFCYKTKLVLYINQRLIRFFEFILNCFTILIRLGVQTTTNICGTNYWHLHVGSGGLTLFNLETLITQFYSSRIPSKMSAQLDFDLSHRAWPMNICPNFCVVKWIYSRRILCILFYYDVFLSFRNQLEVNDKPHSSPSNSFGIFPALSPTCW